MEKISIIIPIYNQENYIERCITSVVAQTYSNLEIIMVDDGSIDRTKEICERLCNKYYNLKYFRQNNMGVSVARNEGIKISTAELLMFVDPDDVLDSRIVAVLEENMDNNTDIICCSAWSMYENRNERCEFFSQDFSATTVEDKNKLIEQLLNPEKHQKGGAKGCAIGVPWAKIYRKDFILKNNILFNPKLNRMQDNIFNMWCFAFARKIKYINEPLYIYNREHLFTIKSYTRELVENILNEREEFFKAFSQYNIGDIPEERFIEKCRFLKSALENETEKKAFHDLYEETKSICASEVFSEVIKNDCVYKPTRIVKLIRFSEKTKMLFIVPIVFKGYYATYYKIKKGISKALKKSRKRHKVEKCTT